MKVVAKDVWGHGPNDILIVSEDAFVFGPVKRTELYKDGCGWAKVHIDISKEEAKALIVSLQQAIESVENIKSRLHSHGNFDPE